MRVQMGVKDRNPKRHKLQVRKVDYMFNNVSYYPAFFVKYGLRNHQMEPGCSVHWSLRGNNLFEELKSM